jgi:hypothetical protein
MAVNIAPPPSQDWRPEMKTDYKRTKSAKINVGLVRYSPNKRLPLSEIKTREDLSSALKEPEDGEGHCRLFVIEDLTKDVIELLGPLGVDPDYFRFHILDQDMPDLISRPQWIQFRFVRAGLFDSSESYWKCLKEMQSFNVLRTLDRIDLWNDPGLVAGMMRSRASLWWNKTLLKMSTVGK